MCVSIYVGWIGGRGGGCFKKKHKNQPLKFLFDWLCFSIRRFQKNVRFAKTGEGVWGLRMLFIKQAVFFLIKVTHAFSHILNQNTWSRKFCTANAFAIDKKCHKEKCLSFASNHTPNFKYKYSIWFYIELCNKLMLPQNNLIKIKIYMNQYFKKNIVQYYFHYVFI